MTGKPKVTSLSGFPGSEISGSEWEFIRECGNLQRKLRRTLTCREILDVARALGYRKRLPSVPTSL